MTHIPISKDDIALACEALGEKDAALYKAYKVGGAPQWRDVPTGFESLARIVVFQLLSTQAAATIWGRLQEAFDNEMTAEKVAAQTPDILRQLGMSNAKAKCVHGLAEAVSNDGLCLKFEAADSKPRETLLALKGIGPWTANIYCMTALKDMNAFPVSDVGLMEAYRLLRGDPERMDAKTFNARAELWSPYKGAAAHLLWAWINASRGLQPTA